MPEMIVTPPAEEQLGQLAASCRPVRGHPRPRSPSLNSYAAGALLLARLLADATVLVDLLPGFLLATARVGATFVVAATTAMAHVGQARAGVTSGLLNTGHELGASLGVALVSAIAGASVATDPLAGRPPAAGFDRAFLAARWSPLLPPGRPPATDGPVFAH